MTRRRAQSAIKSPLATTRTLHGQSAMEFLMTYSWAILIIVIVLAVLFYMGVLNPKNTQANTCIFSPGYSCYSFRLINGSGGLNVDLGHASGKSIVVIAAGCTQNETMIFKDLTRNITVPSAEHRWILGGDSGNAINCTGENGTALSATASQTGEHYRGRVCFKYFDPDTMSNRTVCGDLSARFEPGPGGSDVSPTPTPIYPPPPCAPNWIVGSCPCTLNVTASYKLNKNLNSTGTCITITASDATLDCKNKIITGQKAGYGIFLSSVSGVTVKNCIVSNHSVGILVIGTNNIITVNKANSCEVAGIYLNGASSNTLTSNNASSNTQGGIFLASSSSNILTSNTADSNGWYGIMLLSSNSNRIQGSTINSNQHGIRLQSSNSNNITSNTANSNLYGISLLSSSNNNNFTGNTANSNGVSGFDIVDSDNGIIQSNTATLNLQRGITLQYSNGNNITSNTANSNPYGIYLVYSSNNNITSNTANLNTNHGIVVQGSSGNNLTGNTANSNSGGIYIVTSSNSNLTSNIANLNQQGIILQGSSYNELTDNTANNNTLYGIYLYLSSNNNLVLNKANSNRMGILLFQLGNNNLTDNTANSNVWGINLQDSSDNNLTDNTADSNSDTGIYLSFSSINNNLTSNSMSGSTNWDISCTFDSNATRTGNTCSTVNKKCSGCTPGICTSTACQ